MTNSIYESNILEALKQIGQTPQFGGARSPGGMDITQGGGNLDIEAIFQQLAGNVGQGPGQSLGNYQDNSSMNFGDYASAGADIVGALSGLGQTYLGYKNLGMAKDAFAENRRQFDLNYGNQVKMTNTMMEDRYRTSLAGAGSGASNRPSVEEYMRKNGV